MDAAAPGDSEDMYAQLLIEVQSYQQLQDSFEKVLPQILLNGSAQERRLHILSKNWLENWKFRVCYQQITNNESVDGEFFGQMNPGRVNEDLLVDAHNQQQEQLRGALVLDKDYVLCSRQLYEFFKEHYGGFEIVREVVPAASGSGIEVRLYERQADILVLSRQKAENMQNLESSELRPRSVAIAQGAGTLQEVRRAVEDIIKQHVYASQDGVQYRIFCCKQSLNRIIQQGIKILNASPNIAYLQLSGLRELSTISDEEGDKQQFMTQYLVECKRSSEDFFIHARASITGEDSDSNNNKPNATQSETNAEATAPGSTSKQQKAEGEEESKSSTAASTQKAAPSIEESKSAAGALPEEYKQADSDAAAGASQLQYYANSSAGMVNNNNNNNNKKKFTGVTGLYNIGNTCYMSSALQCLSHVRHLKNYVNSGVYSNEINYENVLGSHGALVLHLAQLLRALWEGQQDALDPSAFKKVFDIFCPLFELGVQHDASEFLNFLLDGLHEDLNRVIVKPQVPQIQQYNLKTELLATLSWKNHLLRNQSIIVDLFQGQFKSKITCLQCAHVSMTFDPFMICQVNLPKQKTKLLQIFVLQSAKKAPLRQPQPVRVLLAFDLAKGETTLTVKARLSELFPEIPPQRFLLAVFAQQSVRDEFADTATILEIADRASSKDLFALEVSEVDHNLLASKKGVRVLLKIAQYDEYHGISSKNYVTFARPMVFNREQSLSTVHLKIFYYFRHFFEDLYDTEEIQKLSLNDAYQRIMQQKQPYKVYLSTNCGQSFSGNLDTCYFCSSHSCEDCELPHDVQANVETLLQKITDPDFSLELEVVWRANVVDLRRLNFFDDHPIAGIKGPAKQQLGAHSTLQQCLEHIKELEILDGENSVYCSQCHAHTQMAKQIEIYRAPKILILQLKRFKITDGLITQKNDSKITFPLDGLDLSAYVEHPEDPTIYQQEAALTNVLKKGLYELPVNVLLKYDLFAVINHAGALDYGHYTALCRSEKDDWFCYSDHAIYPLAKKDVCSENSYILFYQRREVG